MDAFFAPGSVAIAGASKSLMKLGNVPIDNLLRFGYAGRIIPLNPDGGEIMGLRAYPSIEHVDGKVDLAVAVIPRENICAFLESCGRAGVRNVIVTAAGFADAGEIGASLQRDVEAVARRLGVRIMGPNSIGTINTATGFVTSIVTLDPIPAGPVSVVAQSGLFAAGFARWVSSSQYFGLAKVACLGNKVDVSEMDVLAYLEDDPATGVIALHTEGVEDGKSFVDLVGRITRRKPVVVVKPGSSEAGRAAAQSHTGALAGSHEVFMGSLAQTGAVPAADFEEMFDCAKALAYCPLPGGNRLGVVSVTGAGCSLAADACEARGLEVPPLTEESLKYATQGLPEWASFNNPADIWAAIMAEGNAGAYYRLMHAMASQDDVDMLLAVFTIAPQFEFDVAGTLNRIREEFPGKPVLVTVLWGAAEDARRWFGSLESARIPMYTSIERAVAAAGALNQYSSWLRAQH
jgi:acyl-CoA synthetase (NDP forming)